MILQEAHALSKPYASLRWIDGTLVEAYIKAGMNREAIVHIRELLAEARKQRPNNSLELAIELGRMASYFMQIKSFVDAETLFRECLIIREQSQPDDWNTFNAKSILGEALLDQKKYTNAEPLLLQAYDGMQRRLKLIPPEGLFRVSDAVDRLIRLYTALGNTVEVKKWQDERAKYPREQLPMPRRNN